MLGGAMEPLPQEPLSQEPLEPLPIGSLQESLSADKAAEEAFSGRGLATKFVVLLTVTAIVIACSLIALNRRRSSSSSADDDTDDNPQFSETHRVTGPVWVETRTSEEPGREKRSRGVCRTVECEYTRWLINISVNRTMNPCDNFHRYVCSGVTKKYPSWFINEEGRPNMMGYVMTRNSTTLVFRHLNGARVPRTGQTAHGKAAAFFRECPAIGSTPADMQYLINFIRTHQLWERGEPPFDPLDMLVKFMVKTHLPFLFTLDVPFDQYRGKPVISMSRSKDFTDWLEKRSKEIQDKAYSGLIQIALARVEVISLERPDKELVTRVRKHEAKVVRISKRTFPDGDVLEVLPLKMLGQYRNQRNLTDNWIDYLNLHTGGRLPGTSRVSIARKDSEFFHDLFGHPGPVSRHELKTFIAWSVTRFMSQLISVFEPAPTDACSRHTFKFFANAVAYPLYAAVNRAKINEMKDITNVIIHETAKSMNKTTWMDETTRKEAVRKLRTMKRFFAYPPGVSTRKGLDDYYRDIPDIHGPFLKDYVYAAQAYANHNVRKMASRTRSELENTTFFLSTIPANGAYAKFVNALYITAGMMVPPAFTLGAPPEVNYGAIGRVVAHEMMHAFDPDVRRLNANGRASGWWTARSDAEYKKRVLCHNQSIGMAPGMRRSLLENEYLSDMMGERSLFKAYKRSYKPSLTLGGVDDFRADQIFYIAGCLLYCGDAEPRRSHPPLYHRCNVPLINSPQFAKAFSCPKDSPMNPRKKCAFW